MTDSQAFWSVVVMALITLLLRVLPFLLFSGKRKTPPFVLYLGKTLPYAIMGMLVVYCLKNVHIAASPHGLPELIACVVVTLLYIRRRNTLLSILCGTVCYMLLVQFVFA